MKICVVGSGYVGLVTGTCFAEIGNHVVCADLDKKKIDSLNNGILPIYEPGLNEMAKRNADQKRLTFSVIPSHLSRVLTLYLSLSELPLAETEERTLGMSMMLPKWLLRI